MTQIDIFHSKSFE